MSIIKEVAGFGFLLGLALLAGLMVGCRAKPVGEYSAVEIDRKVLIPREEGANLLAANGSRSTVMSTLTEVPPATLTPAPTEVPMTAESMVTILPLGGDIADRNAEISGMAWYGDWLILLPQYPTFSGGGGDGRVFALPRADILAFLDGQKKGPLTPVEIPLIAPGLRQAIPGYEGFEAIVFDGRRAFLTIEASPVTGMTGHLVAAEMAADLSALVVDTERITAVESASGLPNKSDEALLLAGEQLLTIHEANGAGVVDAPVTRRFDYDLQPVGTSPFPTVEYRITDATAIDGDGRFWVINYYFPGESELRPLHDPLAEQYGQGSTHAGREGVERLVELQLTNSGLSLINQPPIQLELLPKELRNWEGIARLDDRGFLLVTDKFPQTILGFVPYAN